MSRCRSIRLTVPRGRSTAPSPRRQPNLADTCQPDGSGGRPLGAWSPVRIPSPRRIDMRVKSDAMRTTLRAAATTLAVLLGALALGPAARADQACPAGARCGAVQVPLDRENPTAGTIAVAY